MGRQRKVRAIFCVAIAAAFALVGLPPLTAGATAAEPEPVIEIFSPWGGADANLPISDRFDGTDNAVWLSADGVGQGAVFLRYSYDAGDGPVHILTTTPDDYGIWWVVPTSIPDGIIIELIYEGVDFNSTVVATYRQHVTLQRSNSTVNINAPTNRFNDPTIGAYEGRVVLGGTRSDDAPPLVVSVGAGSALAIGGPDSDGIQRWSAQVPIDPQDIGTEVRIQAIADGGESEESLVAYLYQQEIVAESFDAVSPSLAVTADEPSGQGEFSVPALDQDGSGISGVNVIIRQSVPAGTEMGSVTLHGKTPDPPVADGSDCDVEPPSSGDTEATYCAETSGGGLELHVVRDAIGTDTFVIQTDEDGDGSYDPAEDVSVTRTFTYGAAYATTHTPSADVLPVGTEVTQQVSVTDSAGVPLEGVKVLFIGQGPGWAFCSPIYPCNVRLTDADGLAAVTYNGTTEGNTTITALVNDDPNADAGLEDVVGFDDVPTIQPSKNEIADGETIAIAGQTRPGALLQLFRHTAGGDNGVHAVGAPVTADESGRYQFGVSPGRNGYYRVRVDDLLTSAKATVRVRVHPFTLQASSPRAGVIKLRANAPARQEGAEVRFYLVRKDGDRERLGSQLANGKGNAALRVDLPKRRGDVLRFIARLTPATANEPTWSTKGVNAVS